MDDKKTQWHPGFVAAMDLEFRENRNDLIYFREYNLNTKPLEIDLLVIKKDSKAEIANEIGKLFKGHNIVEFKSPEDRLDEDVFYKAGAYASLYKSYGRTVGERKADDITVTIVREAKPDGLFRYFKERRVEVTKPFHGIYYVHGEVLFPTQVIVTKELEAGSHKWLRAVSNKVSKQQMRELLDSVISFTKKVDQELADSVLRVSIEANRSVMEELKGEYEMEVLLEFMKPEIDKIVKSVRESDAEKSIECAVKSFRDLSISDAKIKEMLVKNYGLSSEDAEAYL